MNYYELMIRRSRSVEPPAPAIPTDYVFYAPLTKDLNDISQYKRTLTCSGTAPTFTTVDGVECMALPSGSYISTDDISGITLGDHSKAICLWAKIANTFSSYNYPMLMTLGHFGEDHGCLHLIYGRYSKWYAATWGGDSTFTSEYNINEVWNCFIINYDASTSTYDVYLNGQLLSSNVKPNIMNIKSSAGITLAGVKGGTASSYIMPVTTYYRDVLIYDRALTSSEIEEISNLVDITYTITAQDLSCSFYQKDETFGIQYTSPGGTPTFEITSGELPNTISFNATTGQFTGKGLTDADHTYNLTVRLTAPNSTPATCNVTINTYMTARISITGKTFTFYTDGSESNTFTYKSDEAVTFALESGTTLPSGISMSGNTFNSDGTTTTGSYSVVVRGTSQHNATGVTATMYFNVTANEITVTTTELKFYTPKGVTSKQVAYATSHFPITPVYALTGTLPAGVTFDSSTGTFTSDGTQSSEETTSVGVSVASSTGLSTAGTGTISIQVYMTAPAVPDDYILCVPLKTDTVPEVGTFINKNSNWTFGTAPDGTSAIGNTSNSGFSYSMAFDVPTRVTGTKPITLSAWFYDLDGARNFGLMGLGIKSFNNILSPEYSNSTSVGFPWGERWAGSAFGSENTLRPSANTWHNVTITFDMEYVRWYTDGVLVGTSDNASNLSIGSSYLYLGSRLDDSRPFRGYIRNYLVYDRALDASEIKGIYDKGID